MITLITEQEINDLPDEPGERFFQFQKICRQRINYMKGNIDNSDKAHYMNTIVAAAKHFNIDSLGSISVPPSSTLAPSSYQDFEQKLEAYNISFMLERATELNRLSIRLEGSTLDRLRTLLAHLKDQVSKLDLPEGRKDALLKKIDDFEGELSKKKLSFAIVGATILFVAGAVADLGGSADVVSKLVWQIQTTIGVARAEQDKAAALPGGALQKNLLSHDKN